MTRTQKAHYDETNMGSLKVPSAAGDGRSRPDTARKPRPLNLTFLWPAALDVRGGIETFIWEMAQRLAHMGHRVTIMAGGDGPSIKERDGVTVWTLPYSTRTSVFGRILTRCPWTFGVDAESSSFFLSYLLHPGARGQLLRSNLVCLHYQTDALLFSRYLSRCGIPTLYYVSGCEVPPFLGSQRFLRLSRCSSFIACSNLTKERVESAIGLRFDGTISPGVSDVF